MTNSPEGTGTAVEGSTVDYKATLNLPQTAFKMKAGATTREPELEAFWETQQIYEKALAAKQKSKRFLLHDGPPYLSSNKIHIGTALNKILKDIVTRYKNQRGYYTPYVPGYDGHGLPIENAVVKSIKGGRQAISPFELRQKCREFALSNLKGQEDNFKRLGVWGNWEKPYITIDGHFEARQIELFTQMYEKGYVYKGLKPVYWCSSCETALADAEVEYDDHTSPSIYVRFPTHCPPPESLPDNIKQHWDNTAFVIWTTTPWTIPANLGLCVHATLDYVFVKTHSWGTLIIAEALLDTFIQATGIDQYEILHKTTGDTLEHCKAKHPLYDRESLVMLGDHVTTEAGTGIVHTAPGHGMEDYLVGQQYDLSILSPLNNKGVFTAEAGSAFEGLFYIKGNDAVIETLTQANALIAHDTLNHSYPHCWRCHKPVIYRATEQWFISVDKFRQTALDEIKQVNWIPARGETRITTMVEGRTDWCISRQRVWGVPIPVFYCANDNCRQPLITQETSSLVADRFREQTSDIWWEQSADELLNGKFQCTGCNGTAFDKEMDIMDVWFDSGVTHTAVVEERAEELGNLPVELYLEGSDQHRGWFQSALLTSVMIHNKAPYQNVLTHGFVLDEHGRKMSKSLGNVIEPQKIINQYGADVLRLWAASVDYTNDVRIGDEMTKQLSDIYRKIRNTIRFILGNLHGFDASTYHVPYEQLGRWDQYTLHELNELIRRLTDAFDGFEFHRYYQDMQLFCVNTLSSFYFDISKDVLYTAATNSPQRRAVQTVLYELLTALAPMLVPVMPHMAEDIWQNIPNEHRPTFGLDTPPESILLTPWPDVRKDWELPADTLAQINALLELKEAINAGLEGPRSNGKIGSSLEAAAIIECSKDYATHLANVSTEELMMLTLLSNIHIATTDSATTVGNAAVIGTINGTEHFKGTVTLAQGNKCTRCWKILDSVGQHAQHPALCHYCVSAVDA